jgi:beta-lactamase superfamily II metal-dependent hydrolase
MFSTHPQTVALLAAMAACTPTDHGTLAVPGELRIQQIDLGGLATGESTLIVGPDGTSVLVDTGNDRHADDIMATLDTVLGSRDVDWVLITHNHADHMGAFDKLFAGAVSIRRGVVTRGALDVHSDAMNTDEYVEMCGELAQLPHVALCSGSPAPCASTDQGGPWPADSCEGLWSGDLASGEPGRTRISLGDGAVLELLYVNGFAAIEGVPRVIELGHAGNDDENARSLVGAVHWGAFTYLFGGDLTGGGKDTPEAEQALVAVPDLLPHDADVIDLHHHGIDSSSSAAWLDAVLPDDGHPRNALVGAGSLYLSAPDQDVLGRVIPRLGAGRVWANDLGSLAGSDPALCATGSDVIVRVNHAGDRYAISGASCAPGFFSAAAE